MRSKESVGKTALARDFSVKRDGKWAVAGVRCGVKRGFFVKMEDTLNVRKKYCFVGVRLASGKNGVKRKALWLYPQAPNVLERLLGSLASFPLLFGASSTTPACTASAI